MYAHPVLCLYLRPPVKHESLHAKDPKLRYLVSLNKNILVKVQVIAETVSINSVEVIRGL